MNCSIDKFIGKVFIRIGIGNQKLLLRLNYVLQNFDEEELVGIDKISA